jgi:hypothetical protein
MQAEYSLQCLENCLDAAGRSNNNKNQCATPAARSEAVCHSNRAGASNKSIILFLYIYLFRIEEPIGILKGLDLWPALFSLGFSKLGSVKTP